MFGKFENIGAFLDAYVREEQRMKMEEIDLLSLEDQIEVLRNAQITDIAEVNATIKQRQPDDTATPKHYQMIILLDDIIQYTPEIKTDIQLCKQNHLPVFVAIRFGDKDGIIQPIKSGMSTGDKMHFKGQWIPKDKAYANGGEKMSVLHFTHHPAGFTCTAEKCYS